MQHIARETRQKSRRQPTTPCFPEQMTASLAFFEQAQSFIGPTPVPAS